MLPFFRTRPRLVIGSNPPPFSNHLSGPGRLLTGGQVRNWGIHQDGKVKHLQDKKSLKLTKLNKKKLKKWSRKMWLAWWSSNYITPMTDWLICFQHPTTQKKHKEFETLPPLVLASQVCARVPRPWDQNTKKWLRPKIHGKMHFGFPASKIGTKKITNQEKKILHRMYGRDSNKTTPPLKN